MNGTTHLAHSASRSGRHDSVQSHLSDVAERAAGYAAPFGAHEEARLAGLLHDLGKYGDLFQRRLKGQERGIDHWSAGAWRALDALRHEGIAAALAIQGHHLGLQQAQEDALRRLSKEALGRCPLSQGFRLSQADPHDLLHRFAQDGLELPGPPASSVYEGLCGPAAAAMLDVRMLFSALVDADYIETEAHFAARTDDAQWYRRSGPPLDADDAQRVLLEHVEQLAQASTAATEINGLRTDLLQSSLSSATQHPGLYTLTAPTGAGKTLSMLAFALRHALTHGMRRLVVVIPYLTIIEQTVAVYRKALRPLTQRHGSGEYVLENHSLAGVRDEGRLENDDRDPARLLAENWDAPIIVTTSVQFLQSLFANRPRPCRKLHRLANSVIMFDEVQTLPKKLAIPTLATLSRLVERYGATVVFSTATQPAFGHLGEPVKRLCAAGWRPREIVGSAPQLFQRARRTQVEWPSGHDERTSWADLAARLSDRDQALVIVNLKRHALALLEELKDRSVESLFHLSTSMCPVHRRDALAEVNERLRDAAECRLVATQCVEAGVDIDFPVVHRAWGPLDAIAQAAGRCNRNGRAETGTVVVFHPESDGRLYPDGAYSQAAEVTRSLFNRLGADAMDIHNPRLFEEYYRELYEIAGLDRSADDELTKAIETQDFAEVAALYRVIEQDAINVLVPYDHETFDTLAEEARERGLTRDWIAKARPHTVGLFRPRRSDPVNDCLESICVAGSKAREASGDWFIYTAQDHYDPNVGLRPPSAMDCLIG